MREQENRSLSLAMVALVISGEAVFFLPFVLARVFRPTVLEVFGITNTELGLAFSAYGIIALISYFPGGPLADFFAPRKLMAIALLTTASGGLLMVRLPGVTTLYWLYALWGATSILLFWAALLRATRLLGGNQGGGAAFGILDGGRGLFAVMAGSFAVAVYSAFLPGDVETATLAERSSAFQMVIIVFTGLTGGAAILVWFALRNVREKDLQSDPRMTVSDLSAVLKMPTVWIQALIILCAYVAYKGLDDVSLYAGEVLMFDEVSAAWTSTLSMWVRPFAAIGAGFLADRIRVSRMTSISFGMTTAGCLLIASGLLRPGMELLFLVTIVVTSSAVFALRGLYFAIMQEGQVPFRFTGTAVGTVSVVGFTPDIFMGPLMGVLLDGSPGIRGHQQLFAVMAFFALLGLCASLQYRRIK